MAPQENPNNMPKPADGALGSAPPPDKPAEKNSDPTTPKPGDTDPLGLPDEFHKGVMAGTGLDRRMAHLLAQIVLEGLSTMPEKDMSRLFNIFRNIYYESERAEPAERDAVESKLNQQLGETDEWKLLEMTFSHSPKIFEFFKNREGDEK